jgi:hypothetical protein
MSESGQQISGRDTASPYINGKRFEVGVMGSVKSVGEPASA